MAGNVTSVTALPARTPVPSVPQSLSLKGGTGLAVPGNGAPTAGKDVPVREVAELAVDVERAVQRLNELMSDNRRSLRFQVDELSGRTIITVLDSETHEVVRQIPPPELLEVARRLEQASAALIDALI